MTLRRRRPATLPRNANIQVSQDSFRRGEQVPTGGTFGGVKFEDIGTALEKKIQEELIPEKPVKTEFDFIGELDDVVEGIDTLVGMFNEAGGFEQMGVMDPRSRNIPLISEFARQRIGDDRERFNQFFQKGEETFSKLRKNITGTQASFQELQALRPIVPKSSDDPPIFLAKAMATRNSATRARDRKLQRLRQAGRLTGQFTGGIPKFELSEDEAKVEFFKALTQFTGMDRNKAADLVNDTFRNFRSDSDGLNPNTP